MKVKGNGVSTTTTRKDNVKEYVEVWFDEQSITNILFPNNIKRKFRVTYDSNNGGVFTLNKSNGQIVHFTMHKDVLHYHYTNNRHVPLVQISYKMNKATVKDS